MSRRKNTNNERKREHFTLFRLPEVVIFGPERFREKSLAMQSSGSQTFHSHVPLQTSDLQPCTPYSHTHKKPVCKPSSPTTITTHTAYNTSEIT